MEDPCGHRLTENGVEEIVVSIVVYLEFSPLATHLIEAKNLVWQSYNEQLFRIPQQN